MKKIRVFLLILILTATSQITRPIYATNAEPIPHNPGSTNDPIQRLLDGEKIHLSTSEITEMTSTKKEFDKEHVIVVFKECTNKTMQNIASEMNSDISQKHLSNTTTIGNGRFSTMKIPKNSSVKEFLIDLNERDDILIAEPSYKRTITDWTPNDPGYSSNQWQLKNLGSNYGIEMPKAWEYVNTQIGSHGGSPTIITAVLDTGLAYEDRPPATPDDDNGWDFDPSPEVPANIWVNTCEQNGVEGEDDACDDNPYIDDKNGVNLDEYWTEEYSGNPQHTSEEGHPNDDHGHGTHVANIIACQTNNGTANPDVDGAGIAFNTTIMPIKVFDHNGDAWMVAIIEGIQYAIDNNANIINMSFGGSGYSYLEEAKLNEAVSDGLVPVAASGNTGNTTKQYPAAYNNVIAVGASNSDGSKSSYSTYGSWIDLVAPVGETGFHQNTFDCYFDPSCFSGGWDPTDDSFTTFSFDNSSGTSFAAPQVSASVALLKSIHPTFGFYHIRYILQQSAVDVGTSGFDSQTGYGVLNTNNVVQGMRHTEAPGELFRSKDWYSSYAGYWNVDSSKKVVSGDFDGDGDDDVAVMYDYGNNNMKIWVFKSNGSSFSPDLWYQSCPGCWTVDRTKLVSGDFDNDGDDDLAAMYSYLGNRINIWNFKSNGSKFSPSVWYTGCAGCWNIDNSKHIVSGDFDNDGDDDIAAIYSYLGNRINIWNFRSNSSSNFSPSIWYTGCSRCWNIDNSKHFVAGDFDNDGNDDIAAMYAYTGNLIKIWNFKSNSSQFSPSIWYTGCTGCWNINYNPYLVAADIDGDLDVDLKAVYDYKYNRMKIWDFESSGSTFTKSLWYSTSAGRWNVDNSKHCYSGDFDNDGITELGFMYDQGASTMTLWSFFDNP